MKTFDVLKKIEEQIIWRGPNGKAMGHIVLTREEALEVHGMLVMFISERLEKEP